MIAADLGALARLANVDLEISIRSDGRIEIRALDPGGLTLARERADLHPDSADPCFEEAIQRIARTLEKRS